MPRPSLCLAAAILAAGGCANGVPPLPHVPSGRRVASPPPTPASCVHAAPGTPIADRIRTASPGTRFCLETGTHAGPIEIPDGVTVWGPRSAVVRSPGSGDTVRLSGRGAELLGVTVDGSGHRFDLQEAAVHVVSADGARVEGIAIRNALFGIIVEKSTGVILRNSEIEGSDHPQIGLRGDAIRVWETNRSRIERNLVTGSRDIVIWYSSDNEVVDNEVRGGRYGTHFMYSHGNSVLRNRYVGNVVGIFAMYSRELRIENNLLAASSGAAGMGIGLKESSGVRVRDNVIVQDAVGIYIDNSPYEPGSTNEFSGNAIRLCDIGVGFHSSTHDNAFRNNSLRGNAVQVRVDGGGDSLGNTWTSNDFDDYAGYDLDDDGVGDVPYELRTFTGTLIARHPQLDYFRGSPALSMIEAASRILPIYQPSAILVDPRPRTGTARTESKHAD